MISFLLFKITEKQPFDFQKSKTVSSFDYLRDIRVCVNKNHSIAGNISNNPQEKKTTTNKQANSNILISHMNGIPTSSRRRGELGGDISAEKKRSTSHIKLPDEQEIFIDKGK